MIRMLLTTATVIALIGSGVYAQSEKPTATAEAISSEVNPKFVTAQRADQWVFSKFKGTSVVGSDNANVGAVSDLLFDRTGKMASQRLRICPDWPAASQGKHGFQRRP